MEKTIEPTFFSLAGVKNFFKEVQGEFKKIVWPDKKIALGSTGVVIILVILFSAYLGAIDLLLGKIITTILN